MILYHGSYLEISKPDLKHSRDDVELFAEENHLSLDAALAFFISPKYMNLCGKVVRICIA